MIEDQFDIPLVAGLALREKQIQQNYRPLIVVHKWFARRPGTVFRGLLLAEFGQKPLAESYFHSHQFPGKQIADPFMGGGTPLMEANRLGMDVTGYDINPMAYWIVQQELAQLDVAAYDHASHTLMGQLEQDLGAYYETTCLECGAVVPVKYFLWVKTQPCLSCHRSIDLFPGYLIAEDVRHPHNILVCPDCGELNEVKDLKTAATCTDCGATLLLKGPAHRGHVACPYCGEDNPYPQKSPAVPTHRLFALEYFCPHCRPTHVGRFFKKPDARDFEQLAAVETRWDQMNHQFVPDDAIPNGDETNRLHRWGYQQYRDLFNTRQLLGLEHSAQLISKIGDEVIRNALATNLSDLLRYQNMLCRYDTMALKSLDIFSLHGFPVSLVQVESNILGITDPRKRVPVGSGGWLNITEKYHKAKAFGEAPFEVQRVGTRKQVIPTNGEWIGTKRGTTQREIQLHCDDAAQADIPPHSFDAVFTDPPYFDNVQYAELMDFCYVWLRRLAVDATDAFSMPSTRNAAELTGNTTLDRGLDHFTAGLSRVFQHMAEGLKPGGPLAFTYHHNTLAAYIPVAVAILDANLTCTRAIPVPAEMSASIHINGTDSSVIDTVFVCRSVQLSIPREPPTLWDLGQSAAHDVAQLEAGGVRVTLGDRRCLIFGLLVAEAIRHLRPDWRSEESVPAKRARVAAVLEQWPAWQRIDEQAGLSADTTKAPLNVEVH